MGGRCESRVFKWRAQKRKGTVNSTVIGALVPCGLAENLVYGDWQPPTADGLTYQRDRASMIIFLS